MSHNALAGLSEVQAADSRRKHGSNELTPPPRTPLWKQWLEKFNDPTIVILCVCAGIAVALGLLKGEIPWDGVAIFVAVAIATAGGTWSEYKADKAFELLKRDGDKVPVKVRRDGAFHVIPSTDVVVGDVVLLESGDRVPADGVIAEAREARFDESLMTGESASVPRKAGERATGGTYLVAGSATVVVDKVGDKTELGLLASALGTPWACPDETHAKRYRGEGKCEICGKDLEPCEEPPTPLQKRLAGLADSISTWGTIGAVLIFVALVGCRVVAVCRAADAAWSATLLSPAAWPLVVFAVLGVAGLKVLGVENKKLWVGVWLAAIAAAVGVAWASGTESLLAVQSVMQFFMVAVTIIVVAVPEGLPLAIVIALGLGMRKIREDNNLVRKMVATETIGSATVVCSDKTGTLTLNRMSVVESAFDPSLEKGRQKELTALVCAVDSTAEIEKRDGADAPAGNPTECALLLWLRSEGADYAELRAKHPVLDRLAFSADRKRMSTLVDGPGGPLLLVKGAPERVFERCVSVPDVLASAVGDMAGKAIRALALAYKPLPAGTKSVSESDERDLVALGVVGLADPVREDVPAAVTQCGVAGIDVKMVTGDHPATAHAVAEKIGMLKADDLEMTGETFEKTPDEELLALLPRLRVIARAKPQTKRETGRTTLRRCARQTSASQWACGALTSPSRLRTSFSRTTTSEAS